MNFTEAKQKQDDLQNKVTELSEVLSNFPKGPMGLTPDDVKYSSEFKAAKQAFDKAFKDSQEYNKVFTKQFKKEIRAFYAEKRKALTK